MRKLIFTATLLFSSFILAQSFETNANPKVSEIQKNFKFKKYPKNLLAEFSGKIGAEENEPVTVSEEIPGEIIGWRNERGSFTTSQVFQIKNKKLVEIQPIPNDEKFMQKLTKYAPKNNHFEFNSINGRTYDAEFLKKQKNGKYLLTANLLTIENGKENSENSNGIYELEYETLDFRTFSPLKIKKSESKSWITIK